MLINERSEEHLRQSREFIKLIGSQRLCELGGFTRQALTGWKTRGIPRSWMLFFKLKFPKEFNQVFKEGEI